MNGAVPMWAFAIGFGIGLGTMVGAVIILGVAHAVNLLRLPASADTLPQGGDAKQGSVRSKGSAVAESETPSASLHGGIA